MIGGCLGARRNGSAVHRGELVDQLEVGVVKVKAFAYQRVTVELGYSEVLVHLRVAGKTRKVDVLPNGAQLLDEDGHPLSFPVSHGEAGIEYLGLPQLSDHHGCNVSIQFDNSWHCYTHDIYRAVDSGAYAGTWIPTSFE